MKVPLRSSRRRYLDYRARLKQRRRDRKNAAAAHGDATIAAAASVSSAREDRKHRPRTRSFLKLFTQFWGLLAGYRGTLMLVLAAVSLSTMLGLIPLYGTKIVFDSVLREQPLPASVPPWVHLPTNRRELLSVVAVTM